ADGERAWLLRGGGRDEGRRQRGEERKWSLHGRVERVARSHYHAPEWNANRPSGYSGIMTRFAAGVTGTRRIRRWEPAIFNYEGDAARWTPPTSERFEGSGIARALLISQWGGRCKNPLILVVR